MLPFAVTLAPGESPYRQVVYAATKAIVAGDLPAGAPFPSVRELSQTLKINPNTAHKVIAEMVRDGLIAVLPGIGTVVAAPTRASAQARRALLVSDIEPLVVEAKRLGFTRDDVLAAVDARWTSLFGNDEPAATDAPRPIRARKR